MVHDYSFFGSTADFVIKKEHLGFLPFYRIWPSPNARDVGRNMTVEFNRQTDEGTESAEVATSA